MSRHVILLRVVLSVVVLTACGPNLVVRDVFESKDRDVSVKLRHLVKDGAPVARGYDQPATISDVRIAHIIAQIIHKDAEGATHPTIRSVHVYPLAEGISKALASAGPDDEVIAVAYSRERRFGIFTYDTATAFRVTMHEPMINLDFFAIGEQLEKNPKDSSLRTYSVPPELPDKAPKFRIEATRRQVARGRRGVAFEWRDPYYGRPVSLSLRGGRLKRRTILMEFEPEELAPALPGPGYTPAEVRNAQLRALDQLEAARRSGELSEEEFQRRRRLILAGRLEEAGYADPESPDE